jgi:autotransporter-associated beta strand protein
MRTLIKTFALMLFLTGIVRADVIVREINYDGKLSDNEARFVADLDLEVTGKEKTTLPLLDGEVAVLTTKLPAGLRLVRDGNRFLLDVERAGRYRFKLEFVAKIDRQEPWNKVSFTGPESAISSVQAQVAGTGVEVQLLSGTLQELATKDGVTRVRGFLGPDRTVAVRWQSKTAEVTRKALLTCETTAMVQVTPTVMKYKTDLKFEILQGVAPRLVVSLPAAQALTKLQGEGVRDWGVKPDGDHQTLTVEFIKPVEKAYALSLWSEQPVEKTVTAVSVQPPQPVAVERENGSISVAAEDVLVTPDQTSGLRQLNAPSGMLAAYQFYARPFTLTVRMQRLEPVVSASDRVSVRVEESRVLVTHALALNVEKAGIYVTELLVPAGVVVSDVRGEGVEDWKVSAGKLTVNFNARLLGSRRLEVQVEKTKGASETNEWPVVVEALRVVGATKEPAQIGAVAAPGLQLKTVSDALVGAREASINQLPNRTDETLAYVSEQPEWKLTLTAERMAARITADVFNLITIGDGLLGGSATIRYAIINQGVQEFRVKVPTIWKNVEFTGPNIRRKELQGDTWVIGLQEKAWGGYTLVVTYDYQFDPHRATLPIGGIHPEGVERETGSVAITSAANLQLQAQPNGDNIRRVDEMELPSTDRALITRPVLMAYKYQGTAYGLGIDVTRFDELPVLDAAADRTQLTTTLTEDGQMLTQASFMVKNNDRQFQKFTLPEGATLWACFVAGEPVKPEKNGGDLLVPLPRRANRDEAFVVDVMYKQKIDSLKSLTPKSLVLAAPETDMQTTYAEWELFAPPTQHLAGFGGNMIVARGTEYGLRDAWQKFIQAYIELFRERETPYVVGTIAIIGIIVGLIIVAIRRGKRMLVASIVALIVVGVFVWFLSSIRMVSEMPKIIACYSPETSAPPPPTEIEPDASETLREFEPTSGGTGGSPGKGPGGVPMGSDSTPAENTAIIAGSTIRPPAGPGSMLGLNTGMGSAGRPGLSGSGGGGFSDRSGAQRQAIRDVHATAAGEVEAKNINFSGVLTPNQGTEVRAKSGTGTLTLSGGNTHTGGTTVSGGYFSGVISGGGAMVAGIRPIRIELPKSGVRFVFTKVLNVGNKPLEVRMTTMDQNAFVAARSALEALAFLAGLALLGWNWWRLERSSLLVALGLALMIGAAGHLLITMRCLDVAMIVAAPLVGLAGVVWVAKKVWGKQRKKTESAQPSAISHQPERQEPKADDHTPPPIPPVVGLFIASLLMAQTVFAGNMSDGRVLHLKLDKQPGKVADLSGFNNNAEMTVNKPGDGRCGGGFELRSGSGNHGVIPNSPSLEITDKITIAAWVNLTGDVNAGFANEVGTVVGKGQFSPWEHCTTFLLGYNKCASDLVGTKPLQATFRVGVHRAGYEKEEQRVTSEDPLTPGQWYLLVGVYDGKEMRLYVDGKLVASTPHTCPMRSDHAPILIGGAPLFGNNWSNQFTADCNVREIEIWNRALSELEVRELFSRQSSAANFTGSVPVREKVMPPTTPERVESSPVGIVSAEYVGVVKSVDGPTAAHVAQFEGTLELDSPAPNQTLQLFGPDVAVQEFTGPKGGGWLSFLGSGTEAQLVRNGQDVSVLLPQKGRTTVRVKFLVKLTGDVAKRQITFGVPPALMTRLAVTLDEPGATVEVPGAVSFKTEGAGNQQTLVEAVLGAGNRVELSWTPKMKRAAEMATTVFCENTALVSFGGGVVNVRAALNYQVTQGELRQLQVKIPAGQRLMRVEGDSLRTWKLDGQILSVELMKGVTPSYRLTLETETPASATEQKTAVQIPHAADVKRETGSVALTAADELGLSVTQAEDVQKVDVADFARSMPDNMTTPVTAAYRFLKPEFVLSVQVAPMRPVIDAVVRNRARVSSEQMNLTAIVEYTIKRAGVFALRLALPSGYRVERVTGANLAQWVEKDGTLEVTLKERTLGNYTLAVSLSLPWKELPKSVVVAGVQPLDVQKSSGFVTVSAEEGVQIKTEKLSGVTEVPASSAVVAPRLSAEGKLTFRVLIDGSDFVHIRGADIWYVHRYSRLPGDALDSSPLKPTYVNGQAWQPEWTGATNGATSSRFVSLNPPLPESGAYTVQLSAIHGRGKISWVQKPAANNNYEAIVLLDDDGPMFTDWYEFQLEWMPTGGATPIPQPEDRSNGALAFKHIPNELGLIDPKWNLSVTTERIESWVRAEVMNTITLTETLASGRSVIRYDVANAPTKDFRVRVPAAFKNVDVNGANIRRKDFDPATGEWRVELQNKVRGAYTLAVTWEQPWSVKNGGLELMGVEAAGVERETGWVAFDAPPRMKLELKKTNSDLLKMDVRDLPEWAASSVPAGTVFIYRYLRPGYKMALVTQRFEEAEVLQALIDSVRLTSVVAEDGQMMTEMSMAVRNNARQYLEIALPAGAQLWSAFVAGQPVRASQQGGKVLVPMERSSGDATVPVELIYVGECRFPERSNVVKLASPALDVPLKNARWDLYLPPDYRYEEFDGSMKRELAPASEVFHQGPATIETQKSEFTLSDYQQAEADNRRAKEKDVVSSLSNAQQQLSAGNVKDAYQNYSRAKKSGVWSTSNEEMKQLEKGLKQSQALNLQQGQQMFVGANTYSRNTTISAGTLQANQPMQYDEKAAEQQVDKLQKAQEIAVAKALPLRVNLPKRGVHYVFNQALQTEVGHPMTVQFEAINERTTGWPLRIGLGAGGLLVLWALVSVAMRKRN